VTGITAWLNYAGLPWAVGRLLDATYLPRQRSGVVELLVPLPSRVPRARRGGGLPVLAPAGLLGDRGSAPVEQSDNLVVLLLARQAEPFAAMRGLGQLLERFDAVERRGGLLARGRQRVAVVMMSPRWVRAGATGVTLTGEPPR
jgi:hypothetical protein